MSSPLTPSADDGSVSHGSSCTVEPSARAATVNLSPEERTFHKIFPNLPLTEKLVESYQCGLSRKKIVRVGKLYLSSLRLCFYSTFLREPVMVRWEDVSNVEKRTNFVFEAIVVTCKSGDEFSFSTFVFGATAQACKLMKTLWTVRARYATSERRSGPPSLSHFFSSEQMVPSPDDDSLRSPRTSESGGFVDSLRGSPSIHRAASRPRHDASESGEEPLEFPIPPHQARSSPTTVAATSAEAAGPGFLVQPSLPGHGIPTDAVGRSRADEPLPAHPPNMVSPLDTVPEAKASPLTVKGFATLNRAQTPPSTAGRHASPSRAQQLRTPQPARQPATQSPWPPHELSPQSPTNSVSSASSRATSLSSATWGPSLLDNSSAPRSLSTTAPTLAMAPPLLNQSPGSTAEEGRPDTTACDGLRTPSSVPANEPIIDYFQCSYVSGVHRLGRMYITSNHIIFSSVMMTESLAINFADVAKIVKEQTMMILDGIAITLISKQTLCFTSFVSRDAAFNILIHYFNAMKSVSRDVEAEKKSPKVETSVSGSSPMPPGVGFTTKTSVPDVTAFPVVSSLDELSRVATDYGSALSDYSCFAKPVITPVTLPEGATLLDVFRVVFDDGATLLQTYHAKRGDTEQKWGEWRPAAAGSPSCSGQRLFECLTIIKVVMAKVCQYTEYQRYAFMTVGGAPSLVVQLSGQALGVMFSDSFRAETLLVFTQGPKAVTMSAFGHVQFLRSVWVKKKILSTTLDTEMPECFTMLAQMIVEYLRSMSSPNGICPLSMEENATSLIAGGCSPSTLNAGSGAESGAPSAVTRSEPMDGQTWRGMSRTVACIVSHRTVCGAAQVLMALACARGAWVASSSDLAAFPWSYPGGVSPEELVTPTAHDAQVVAALQMLVIIVRIVQPFVTLLLLLGCLWSAFLATQSMGLP